jgi:hypothetical protein
MGGIGSGEDQRTSRLLVEDHLALDVHHLARAGGLVHSITTVLHWPHPIMPLTVHARCDHGRVMLAVNGGDEVAVLIDRVTCFDGSDRPHFQCPTCTRRVSHLFVKGREFACRICLNLDYSSRHRHRWNPMLHRIAKLRRRLGAERLAGTVAASPAPPQGSGV